MPTPAHWRAISLFEDERIEAQAQLDKNAQATRKMYGYIATQCCASQARRRPRTQRRSTFVIRGPPASLILPADVVVHGDHSQATLGYNVRTNSRTAHNIPHLAPCALDLLAAAHVDTPAHSLVVAHVRLPDSGTGRAGPLGLFTHRAPARDGTSAHSVLGPSAPRIPPTLLQSRARAVSAAAQFRPLPALESAPRHVPEILVARVEAAHKLPARPPAEPIRRYTAAPGGAVQVPPLRCPRHVESRTGPNSHMRGARAVFPRGASPSAVCLHGELGYWHAAATASLCERSRRHERQVALLQLCSIVTRRPCREFCGRRPGPARIARPRHIPACGAGHGSNFPPRPPPVSPPRLLSPMRSLSVPISAPPTKLLRVLSREGTRIRLDAASPGRRLRAGFGRVARRRAGIRGERGGSFAQGVGKKLGTRKYHVESQLHSNRRLTDREFRRARNFRIWTCQSGCFGGDVGLQERVAKSGTI
ncbi:hypothetical protein B0H17DRAFT_1294913 [Mycena rosella]|uniref:Uncharacterized protein n=1 Tax=Mycena rosella TaxID=1033263 RepID=A0AAD7GHT1_MYCRO|nr:hypothetical protein B0H17DRAFT_1294913 [Mycena rosella]